ncbi:potassium transporter 12 isoform A [Micractinium conductrix]|uniref:Potassium transporter n=1 Tax=Micractinium conductrix TaxID=554055 RepID=A0A2P6V7Q1_9CHLO|nr:potassium transporter 12 isoform A [Micractinium conductrix]|eukprot:PSC70116.1 potassium transporter 12 isoform A [Micractinium conductrix]
MAARATVSSLWANDIDLEEKIKAEDHQRCGVRGWPLMFLTFSTLGIVYGDIGTSPLYTYAAVFPDGAPDDANQVYGVCSTIFWTITSIVLIKYIIFTLSADDNGEGGIFALYALICRAVNIRSNNRVHEADLSLLQYKNPLLPEKPGRLHVSSCIRSAFQHSHILQGILLVVVLLAATMIISDGVLTPAISVVSAAQGIQFNTDISNDAVVGIAIAIVFLLFAVQSFGTERVSFLFSPVVLLWFVANAAINLYNMSEYGWGVWRALSPSYMYYFWKGQSNLAWHQLSNIMLAVTGGEALYADLGHFNANSIRLSFIFVVYPSLTITYLGQAAMIVNDPRKSSTAFWSAIPAGSGLQWPMVVLAVSASIIASQALISGSFSIVNQAIAMGAFPRLSVKHTSSRIKGQVYIPEVNWFLMGGTLIVVGVFQTGTGIANAYGLAVITVMLVDTTLLTIVMITAWRCNILLAGTFWLVFTFITASFFSASVLKVPKGAWFSLVLSGILATVTYVWHYGQSKKMAYVKSNRKLIRDMFEEESTKSPSNGSTPDATTYNDDSCSVQRSPNQLCLSKTKRPVARVPGIGIYFNELLLGVPPALERFMSLAGSLPKVVVFITVRNIPVPTVLPAERLLLRRLRFEGFFHVVARYGYMESIDMTAAFVETVIQELHEYLDPSIFDLATEATSNMAQENSGAAHDLEAGLQLDQASWDGGEGPSHGLVVQVDASESLSNATGRKLKDSLAVQLVSLSSDSLPLRPDGSLARGSIQRAVHTTAATGPERRSGSLTAAVVLDHEALDHDVKEGPAPAPWVQMPSMVRRVQTRLRNQRFAQLDPVSLARASTRSETLLTTVPAPEDTEVARRQLFRLASMTPGFTSPSGDDEKGRYLVERQTLLMAKKEGVAYIVGQPNLRAKPGSNWVQKLVLETGYGTLAANSRRATDFYKVPREDLMTAPPRGLRVDRAKRLPVDALCEAVAARQAKRCHIAIDGDQHQQQQQAQPPLIPLQLQLQLQLPLPRTLLGPAHGLVALLVGSGGTPAAAADRLEAAILENGDFYCNGCKVKCCLACTIDGAHLGETAAYCPLCAEHWPAHQRTDYLLESAADRQAVAGLLRLPVPEWEPPSIVDMRPRVECGWDIFGCGSSPDLERVARWLRDLEPSARLGCSVEELGADNERDLPFGCLEQGDLTQLARELGAGYVKFNPLTAVPGSDLAFALSLMRPLFEHVAGDASERLGEQTEKGDATHGPAGSMDVHHTVGYAGG